MDLTVDLVPDVKAFRAGRLEPHTDLGGGRATTTFIQGVGKSEKEIVILLNVSRVLAGSGDRELANAAPPNA